MRENQALDFSGVPMSRDARLVMRLMDSICPCSEFPVVLEFISGMRAIKHIGRVELLTAIIELERAGKLTCEVIEIEGSIFNVIHYSSWSQRK